MDFENTVRTILERANEFSEIEANKLREVIETLKSENADLKERINKYWKECDRFETENARLREALESISGIYNDEDEPSKGYAGNIAREALKGGE